MSDALEQRIAPRRLSILNSYEHELFARTDRLFTRLMIGQWVAGVLIALAISPRAWAGSSYGTHIHVWASLILGGLITAVPVFVAARYPGTALSRHTIAVGQCLTSALLIHLTGGRIETHFHVFGSLAFLAFYRDWKVLITASVVITLDHMVRGIFWPQSVFGVLTAAKWRWLEHAAWVVFEDFFLLRSCLQGRKEMNQIADRQARLEASMEGVEDEVQARTSELRTVNADLEQEVRDRVEVQRALRSSEAQTRAIVEMAAEGIISIDESGVVTFFNASAETIFGYQAQEVLGQDISMLLAWPDGEAHDDHFRAYLQNAGRDEPSIRTEVVSRRKDGSSFPMDLSLREIQFDNERFFTAMVRDISDRKRAEMTLTSQARQQAAAAALGQFALSGESLDRVMERAVSTVAETLDAQYCKILELLPDQDRMLLRAGVGWKDGLVGVATVGAHHRSQAGYTINTASPVVVEDLRLEKRFDGPELLHEHGVVSGISVTIHAPDIPFGVLGVHTTDQRAFTRDDIQFLLVIANVLAQAIERRSVEDRLREATLEAEAGSLAKSEFLANVSHEIRTPMNGIIGMSELALDTEPSDEVREYLGTVVECSESLLFLINDILDLSKVEAGKLELEQIDFNLVECLEKAAGVLASKAASKCVELVCSVAPDVPTWIRGDPVRLLQVLVNLSGNAVKFTDDGEVELTVELADDLGERAGLLFSVRDTGIGIPVDQQGRIFESFTQADGATTRLHGGTGLGLTISKQLVHMMGGRLGVESEPGRGSTFSFRLDLSVGESTEPPEDARSRATRIAALRGKRILVVDDNETHRRVLEARLAGWNCSVQTASGGAQSLQLMRSANQRGEPFELLLVDIRMPAMDGLEVERAVYEDASLGGPGVVLLSSHGGRESRQREEPRRRGFLAKPVRLDALLGILTKALSGAPELPMPQAPAPLPTSAGQAPERRRVLLVEDNAVNVALATAILRKAGCEVAVAPNGSLAVELTERRSFDLVFMDLQMPIMGGLEATRLIRERENASGGHVPIVAMTAHAMKDDEERCREAGMDGFLSKPVRAADVAAAVRRHAPRPGDAQGAGAERTR